jgi:hypothetical protein
MWIDHLQWDTVRNETDHPIAAILSSSAGTHRKGDTARSARADHVSRLWQAPGFVLFAHAQGPR